MEYLFLVLIGFILAVTLEQIIIPRVMVISLRKRLFDLPDARKVHHTPISRLGGVTFFPVILLVMCGISIWGLHTGHAKSIFFSYNIVYEMLCLMIGMMLLYLIGVCDDLIGVSYRRKFLIQILSAAFIPLAGLSIHHFHGLFGIGAISPWLGVPLTVFLTVFITNSINLIDGIDGLASGLCMEALVLFGIGFVLHGWWMYALLSFVCVGVLIPFFLYNVFGNADKGRKIFMGDTGTLTLGFVLSLLTMKYILSIESFSSMAGGSALVWVFSFLWIPCLDVLRVMLGRIRRKAHPFKPDKSHIHHLFLLMGFTPRKSLVLIQLLSILFVALTYIMIKIGIPASLVFIVNLLVWMLVHWWLHKILEERKKV